MPSKKPAIALGPIDDIVKAVVKELTKKQASRSFSKGQKAFGKMEKIGGVTKSIDPKKSSAPKTIRQWERADKKFTKNMGKFNKLNEKNYPQSKRGK